MAESKKGLISFHQQTNESTALEPQAKAAALKQGHSQLFIGIPKEITAQENRVPLSPSSVELLVNQGHNVIIEAKTGEASNFSDVKYGDAGAKITKDRAEIYSNADIILKIEPPTLEEVDLMRGEQLIISALQLDSLDQNLLAKILHKKLNAVAFEFLQDESGSLPVIRAMSEIAGHAAVLLAAEYLSNARTGKGELLGGFTGIPPTQIVIIGAGSVGEYAARAAIGLGANVKVFDNEIYRLRRLQEVVGSRVFTSTLQPKLLSEALRTCDVAIGALRGELGSSPVVVTEQMVKAMKSNSVIIDVSIDQGGIFETSQTTNHKNPIHKVHDVIHYGVPNITSRVSRTASYALSNILTPLLMDMSAYGGFYEHVKIARGLRQGVYAYKGKLTNVQLAKRFKMKYDSVDIIIPTNYNFS